MCMFIIRVYVVLDFFYFFKIKLWILSFSALCSGWDTHSYIHHLQTEALTASSS